MSIHRILLPSLLVAALCSSCGPDRDGAPRPSPWQTYFRAGEEALQQGNYPQAQQQFEAARGELADAADPRLVPTLQRLAGLHALQGRLAPAESLYTAAIGLAQRVLPPLSSELIQLQTQAAAFYLDERKYAQAESLYTEALSRQEQLVDPRTPQLAAILDHLADLYRAQGRQALADSLDKRAMGCKLGAQAYEYYLQGSYAQAETFYRRALGVQEKALGDHPDLARTCRELGMLYQAIGDLPQAEAMYRRAIAIAERTLGDHPELARTLDNLALLLKKSKRDAEAQAAEDRARQIRHANEPSTSSPSQESR
ncbi:MAG: tetratricopeptide repeat protein [Candidatus Latescibacteria bacterium]|nr:tetratricopeptide repeat protein [Candidatus Latescibacterota bacterium]